MHLFGSKSNPPVVSIIIPTYNRENYIIDTIQSVLQQDYQNYELIIIDDGSTDNTKTLISKLNDTRLIYKHQSNKGRSYARNVGIKLAKGKYIAFLDSDDLYLPNKISAQVKYLDNNPHVGMVYTSAYCIDGNGTSLPDYKYEAIDSGSIYDKIAFFTPVTITLPTVMVRREIIKKAGLFDNKMYRFEDTDMWRRISKITHIEAMNIYTCNLRTHADNHLLAQNPKEIINALHYYANKIIKEDKNIESTIINNGIANLYSYYAKAFMTVGAWHHYGAELFELAKRYECGDRPPNMLDKIKLELEISWNKFKYILRRIKSVFKNRVLRLIGY